MIQKLNQIQVALNNACYGSEFYHTPNIDKLAERGISFTNAYSANPFCSPTRASILTGLYPARIGLLSASGHAKNVQVEKVLRESSPPSRRLLFPLPVSRLKTEYTTIAEVFKDAGYATGHFGKWHLGTEPYSPLEQGFDVDIPHSNSGWPPGGYLDASNLMRSAGLPARPNEHVEDRMAEEAIEWMKNNKDRPFFLNYWAFSVHGPWEGKAEYIKRFAEELDNNNAQRNPIYAAMIKSMDDAVGRLAGTIDELGLGDNTIIIFASDNGGVVKTDKKADHLYKNVPITSNAPLREGKGSIYEGGSRVPTIVSWPGEIKPGSFTDALFSSVDFFPTLLEACGLTKPENLTFDGVSQLPVLKGEGSVRDVIYDLYPFGNEIAASIRQGDWKLLRFFCDNEDYTDRHELYDLGKDIGETTDLYNKKYRRATKLAKQLDEWLKDTEAVIPIPNPAYEPDAKPAK
jgi:arylsulfatase A-like enzyme